MSFAANLKRAMEERQMSQAQLSGLTGIGKPSISQYLSGKNVPKMATVERLADALEVTVDFLTNDALPPMKAEFRNVPVELTAQHDGRDGNLFRIN
ncbi:MAG: helix-turn-helix transcriptional regulator, partial [Kiritimatiellia bacterium]